MVREVSIVGLSVMLHTQHGGNWISQGCTDRELKVRGVLTLDVTVSLTLRLKVLRISIDDLLCNLRFCARDAILHVRVKIVIAWGNLGRSDD